MNDEYDVWNPLANLLANLIEKYASELNLDNLPSKKNSHLTDTVSVESIEKQEKV